jgi:hypothetical protein
MKTITTLFLTIITSITFAQNTSLTIFNNSGQQFFVILNGIKQNSIPQTNMKIGGMSTGMYEVKLIFADGKTGDINKKMYLDQIADYTARVVINGTKRKLQFFNMSNTQGTTNNSTIINYRPNDQTIYSDQVAVNNSQIVNSQSGTYGQTTTQTSTTTTITSPNSGNTTGMNVGVNVQDPSLNNQNGQVNSSTTISNPSNNSGQIGMNVGINVQDPTLNNQNDQFGTNININVTDPTNSGQINSQQSNSTNSNGQFGTNTTIQGGTQTTTTTTTTTSTTTINGQPTLGQTNQNTTINNSTNQNNQSTLNQTNSFPCTHTLTDIESFVKELKSETFDANRKELILLDLNKYCVNSDQSHRIIETLTFEQDRLEISKFLYDRMFDKTNAKKLLDLFTFDASKNEYRDYIRNH